MKKASRNYWDSICNISRNPRMFYFMLNKISNHISQDIITSNLIIHNNRIISNPQQQSNLFVNFFALRIQHEPIPLDYNGVYNSTLNHPIQIQETIKGIQTTRNSSPGADNIPAAWFKRLNNQQVTAQTYSQLSGNLYYNKYPAAMEALINNSDSKTIQRQNHNLLL
ncbi:hypothetical protein AVEN_172072-1 [Araneus ventricosus]|uniref:Uncharacterized protein n=1 Tax=Araneus ventricosus TaxID=182803 RepID=A0A4Y2N8Q1_ARAVE|nr:hypothetical protein AVEN_172072-1 [Araneus ventricosus]